MFVVLFFFYSSPLEYLKKRQNKKDIENNKRIILVDLPLFEFIRGTLDNFFLLPKLIKTINFNLLSNNKIILINNIITFKDTT